MIRALLLLLSLALSLAAQQSSLQLATVSQNVETPFSSFLDVGTSGVGDALDTRVRIRNISTGSIILNQLFLNGSGFTLNGMPALPYPLPPQGFVDVIIRFNPVTIGQQSGSLAVNQNVTVLHATGVGTIMLYLDQNGSRKLLPSGTPIDLGSADRGSSKTLNLIAINGAATPLTISVIQVTGDGFQLGSSQLAPATLTPQQAITVPVVFAPNKTQLFSGVLRIDSRSWPLSGTMTEPTLPAVQMTLDATSTSSGRQGKLSVGLANSAPVNASGRVTITFQPQTPGAVLDDGAIQFVANSSRTLSFSINQGATAATFGALSQAVFQTGTTAGTITFTATVGNSTQQVTATVAQAVPNLDVLTATHNSTGVEIDITGYDNTASASQLSFVFYDKSGVALNAAPILYNATTDFRKYFAASKMGGAFGLRAIFPVAGDATLIKDFDVELSNSQGSTRSGKTAVQ